MKHSTELSRPNLHSIGIELKLSHTHRPIPLDPEPTIIENRMARKLLVGTDWRKALALKSDGLKVSI